MWPSAAATTAAACAAACAAAAAAAAAGVRCCSLRKCTADRRQWAQSTGICCVLQQSREVSLAASAAADSATAAAAADSAVAVAAAAAAYSIPLSVGRTEALCVVVCIFAGSKGFIDILLIL